MQRSLIVWHLDELDDDVLAWLDLQHLQNETQEGGGLNIGTKYPSDVVKLQCTIHKQLS